MKIAGNFRLSFYSAVLLLLTGSDCVWAKAWGSRSFADVVKQGSESGEVESSRATWARQETKIQTNIPSKKPPAKHPPLYSKLPRGAKKYRVRNVYDGDTLTLVDEQRVRLLGIDTPEIKERQPYAQEAKAYTKSHCDKRDIWLSFERQRKDHYGRLLAFVWVKEGDGYLCVNEGLVAAGLASVYSPDSQSLTNNWDVLLALQKKARTSKVGLWKNFQDFKVYKTKNGSAYHLSTCQHLSTARHLTPMKVSEAADAGLHPCRSCLG